MLTAAVSATDDRQPAATQMVWSGSPVRLTGMKDPVTNDTVALYYGGDALCSAPPSGFAIAPGLLCKVTSFDSRSTDLFYAAGRLARVVAPGGATTDYGYDASNRISSVRDPLAFDMIADGLRSADATTTWQVSYDGSGRASVITAPAGTTGATRQTTTIGYVSAPSGSTLGESTVTLSGVANPQGYSSKLRYDTAYRTRETFDQLALKTEINYDGVTDRVNYTDTAVGTGQAMRSSTIYDTSVVFNGMSRPVTQYGPAPPSAFNVSGGVATPNGTLAVPTTQTTYDGGINGLSAAWFDDSPQVGETYTYPNRPSFRGAPKLHTILSGPTTWNWGAGSPDAVIPADNWSLRLSGLINFTTAGTWTIGGFADDGVRVTIDDQLLVDTWATPTATVNAPFTATVGWHRIQVDFREDAGGAAMNLAWLPPASSTWAFVPNANLKPDLGLVTSTTDAAGIVTNTGYTNPAIGLPTSVAVNPAGLNLVTSTTYESPGTGSFLRRLSRTLPMGSTTTNTYTNYSASATAAIPAGCSAIGLSGTNKQAGMVQQSTAADPDNNAGTTGVNGPIQRETIYDASRRPTAERVVADGAVWSCTSYDSRGRTAKQYFPAWGGFAARTVTFNYRPAYGPATADPSVTKTTDDSLPVGQRDTWSKVDLLGRQIEYVDVWGTKTVTSYDTAGRVTQAVVTVGGSGVHTMAYAYNATGSGVNQLSTVTYTPSGGSASVLATVGYDAIGRQAGITYANGTAKTAPVYDSYQRATTNAFTQAGGAALTSTTTTFDVAGRVKHQVVDGLDPTPATDTFTYDAAGRLTGFLLPTPGGTATATYNYTGTQLATCGQGALASGKNSNRVSRTYTPPGGSATTYNACFDHADRVGWTNEVGFNASAFPAYDVHGNMVTVPATGSTETHVYDIADRHMSTKIGATTTVSYARDATDRPVLRTEGATTVRYGYSGAGDSSSLVLSTTNTIVERTISLPGGVMVTTRSGGNMWFYPNTHGDIAATTNNAGVKQGATVFYDPTGNVISGTTPDSSSGNWDFAWHGTAQRPLEHATGLMPIIEMGARQYPATLGRFLQLDPVEGGCRNGYVYVIDPVNFSDLPGLGAAECIKSILEMARALTDPKGVVGRYGRALHHMDGDPTHVAQFLGERRRLVRLRMRLNNDCKSTRKGPPMPPSLIGLAKAMNHTATTVLDRYKIYPGTGNVQLSPPPSSSPLWSNYHPSYGVGGGSASFGFMVAAIGAVLVVGAALVLGG